MDKHHSVKFASEESESGATKTSGEDDDSVNLRPSEVAKRELQRIKGQLKDALNKASGSGKSDLSTPSQETTNPSVPTDLTISDISHGTDYLSVSVLYEAPKSKMTAETTSSNNLLPGMPAKVGSYQGKMVGLPRPQHSPVTKDRENKIFERMRDVFDTVPTPKVSFSELQKEFTENRIQSHQKICELNAQVTVKSKESDFLEHQLAVNHTDLKVAKSEVAIKEAENRNLRKQIAELESQSSKRILELTLQLQEKASKADTLERLYSQMDQMTYVDSVAPEKILSGGIGSTMNVPSSFKYKLQQSSDLAQRLKDERDHLERCRDEADMKLKETETKYQGVLIELNKLKIGEDVKLSSAKASLQLKCFELDRVSLVLEEYQQKYRTTVEQNNELKKKIQRLNDEINDTKCQMTEDVTRLSLELQTKSSRLDLYEKIEDSLDDMILKAAAVPGADVGKDILSLCSAGAGPSLPTDSRRRLQQAFDLAKKNVELEKAVAEQKQEILELYDERHALRQEVQSVKSLNGYSVGQLIETITEKTREIGKLNKRIGTLEKDMTEIKQSKEILQQTVENLQGYHDKVLGLYHSGAHQSLAKLDRQDEASDTKSISTKNQETVSSKSSLSLKSGTTSRGNSKSKLTNVKSTSVKTQDAISSKSSLSAKSGTSSRGSTKYKQYKATSTPVSTVASTEKAPLTVLYGSTEPPSTTDSVFTFPATDSRYLLEPPGARNAELGAITEESDNNSVFEADSIILESISSVTSSMLFPPPPMVRTRSPIRVSVRKIPSRSSSSKSKKSASSGSKRLPGRQIQSADLVAENAKKKEKPVPLRKFKVKPSPSDYF